jgi:hypothetical protein
MGSVQLGIATCDGCFSNIAKTGDAILRTNGMATGDLIIAARSNDGILFSTGNGSSDSKRMEIMNNGKVVIGNVSNTPNNYKLYVEDGILAERLKVAVKTSSDWADFVFAENYRLRSLAETKLFIQENQHLPDVPSAAEMVEKGLDVREMNALLLQKIEELTLHVIALNERVEELEELRDLEELLELEESGSTDSFQEEEVKE